MNHAIKTHGLGRRYGRVEAVHDVSLSVPSGSIYALLGPNGAGKTTTIKLVLNLLAPTAGAATILGADSQRLGPATLREIGYVSENQRLPDWMTVSQLIAFCRPMYPKWDDAFCAKLLADFDLPRDRKIRSLSRGMKMKAALLTSLAYRPRLLILDEPFTGLDPLVRDEVIRGILELTEQENWTVFISSHDIDEVERLADWVGVINAGKLQLEEPVAALQSRFRRLECAVPGGARLPAILPKAWLLPELNAHCVSVVDSNYRTEASEQELAEVFTDAGPVNVTEMSLREVFLTLARHYRISTSTNVVPHDTPSL